MILNPSENASTRRSSISSIFQSSKTVFFPLIDAVTASTPLAYYEISKIGGVNMMWKDDYHSEKKKHCCCCCRRHKKKRLICFEEDEKHNKHDCCCKKKVVLRCFEEDEIY